MFCLFYTTPINQDPQKAKRGDRKEPSKSQVFITWSLLLLWLVLMSFGVVSIINPEWLQELSQQGIVTESRTYKNSGDILLQNGHYQLAISDYQRALEINPDNIGALVNLAITFGRVGNWAKGFKILNDALQMEGVQKNVIYLNLGEFYKNQKKWDKAIDCYKNALAYKIDQVSIYHRLGNLYVLKKQYEDALDVFKKALKLTTNPKTQYQDMLRRSIALFKYDTLNLSVIEKQLAQGVSNEDIAFYDLNIIQKTKKYGRDTAKIHHRLGVVYAQLEAFTKAAEHLRISLQIWPGNTDAKRDLQKLQLKNINSNSPIG